MWQRLLVAAYTRTPERPRRAVVRLTTPAYRVGVLGVLTRPDGRLLLVDQPYVEGWSLPGGDVKRRENPGTALARELREELGLRVTVDPPRLAALRLPDRWVTFVTRVELGEGDAERAAAVSPELRAVRWWDPAALPPLHGDAVEPLRLVGVRV